MLFDFIGLEPNVARDPRVKKPKQVREEPQPPSAEQYLAILEAIGPKWRCCSSRSSRAPLRLGEATSLRWADVDAANLRLRLPRSATKRDQARWVYLPPWCMEAIEATCPLEDRVPDRRVFQGITEALGLPGDESRLRNAKVPYLLTARPAPPANHDLAAVRCASAGTRRASRPCARLDEPRRLFARDAARRGRGGTTANPDRVRLGQARLTGAACGYMYRSEPKRRLGGDSLRSLGSGLDSWQRKPSLRQHGAGAILGLSTGGRVPWPQAERSQAPAPPSWRLFRHPGVVSVWSREPLRPANPPFSMGVGLVGVVLQAASV